MKKKLAIALACAALLASFAGCGDVDDGMVTDAPSGTPVHTAAHGTTLTPDVPAASGAGITAAPSMAPAD